MSIEVKPYKLERLVYLAAFIFVAIWFTHLVLQVLLLFFFAVIIAIVLNAPVTWLESKGWKRTLASLVVFFGVLLFLGLIGWMIVPKIATQIKLLATNLPTYIESLDQLLSEWIGSNGADPAKTVTPAATTLPSAPKIFLGVAQYFLSIGQVLLLIIFFFCLVIYMLLNPAPLLDLYLSFFPENKRERIAEAFANASTMTIGWMWSNVIAGLIRAVIVWFFLYFMDIPGVWVWAGVTFFAELIPRLGFYIMSVPPILLALSISPTTALWVAGFYIALDEIIGDFIIPRIRSSTMKIHPVSILLMIILMSAAFGIMGAFIATPLTAFIKAHYETFNRERLSLAKNETYIDRMLKRK
jgi:predicted PurR-regulated permease PerM